MRKGFTLIELLVVVGFSVVIVTVGFLSLSGRQGTSELVSARKKVVALLSEARGKALGRTSSSAWGVHFEHPTSGAPFFALFITSAYSTSTEQARYALPTRVVYLTSTLVGGVSRDIYFAEGTGLPSASSSVKIELMLTPGQSSTISVASSGLIQN